MARNTLSKLKVGATFTINKPVNGQIGSCCIFMKLISEGSATIVIVAKAGSQFRTVGTRVSREFIPLGAFVEEVDLGEALLYSNEEGEEILLKHNP